MYIKRAFVLAAALAASPVTPSATTDGVNRHNVVIGSMRPIDIRVEGATTPVLAGRILVTADSAARTLCAEAIGNGTEGTKDGVVQVQSVITPAKICVNIADAEKRVAEKKAAEGQNFTLNFPDGKPSLALPRIGDDYAIDVYDWLMKARAAMLPKHMT